MRKMYILAYNTKKNDVYFPDFIRRNFKKIIRKICDSAGNLFVQDGNLSQNSKDAAKE